MKPHRILKAFKGTQDGISEAISFAPGTERHLSDSLAAIVVKEGWAAPVEASTPAPQTLEDKFAEVKGLEAPVPAGDIEHDLDNPADLRETKVTEPDETKPAKKPAAKKK